MDRLIDDLRALQAEKARLPEGEESESLDRRIADLRSQVEDAGCRMVVYTPAVPLH